MCSIVALSSSSQVIQYVRCRWYHQVRSLQGRNLAINIWFIHLLQFISADCKSKGDMPDFRPLEQFQFGRRRPITIAQDHCEGALFFPPLSTIIKPVQRHGQRSLDIYIWWRVWAFNRPTFNFSVGHLLAGLAQ